MDRLHCQSVTQHETNALLLAQIGQPIPAEEALDGYDEVLSIRLDEPEEGFTISPDIAVYLSLAAIVEDADVHAARVQVDSAVEEVTLGVELHRGLFCEGFLVQPPPYRVGRAGRGRQMSIQPLHRTREPRR